MAAIFAGIPSVYYGPKAMLEAWDWYLDRFRDAKVLDELRDRKITDPLPAVQLRKGIRAAIPAKEIPYTVKELSEKLHRSETSILNSLRRLRRHGRVDRLSFGWIFKA